MKKKNSRTPTLPAIEVSARKFPAHEGKLSWCERDGWANDEKWENVLSAIIKDNFCWCTCALQ